MNEFLLPNGQPVKLGQNAPEQFRLAAVPAWSEANPVLQEDDCADHDDLAKFYPESKSQSFNNCTNASIAALAKAQLESQGVKTPDLSRSFAYAQANGGRDEGASCRAVIQLIMGKGDAPGLPTEELWPEKNIYMPRNGFPQNVIADAKARIALEVYQCLTWNDVISAVARRFGVYQGFVLGQNWFKVPKSGKVAPWDGQFANGHATVSRGLTRKFGDLRVIVPNTWGTAYGENGVGYVDKSYYWTQRGNFVNLEAYAIRAFKIPDADLPQGV